MTPGFSVLHAKSKKLKGIQFVIVLHFSVEQMSWLETVQHMVWQHGYALFSLDQLHWKVDTVRAWKVGSSEHSQISLERQEITSHEQLKFAGCTER